MRQSTYDRNYRERMRYRWDFDNQLWYRDIDRDRATAALRDRQRAKVQKRIERDQTYEQHLGVPVRKGAMFLPKAELDVNGLPMVGYDD